jgi:leucyl aminopeptidase (aminopeptidase T)
MVTVIIAGDSCSILFDEKIGGTVHMALGAGYAPIGSSN